MNMVDYMALSVEERHELYEKVKVLRESGYTKQEIADQLGLTRERVTYIINKLFRKEHHPRRGQTTL